MRWQDREQSKNVEDRRGMGPKVAMGGGFIGILVVLGMILFNVDPKTIQQFLNGQAQNQQQQQQNPGEKKNDAAGQFIGVVLRDTETVWTSLFEQNVGKQYKQPELVLFSDTVDTACGRASSASGPFYCPADEKIYIDPTFFDELRDRHGAGGDFAAAYVIAHEVAHHIQKQIGFSDKVAEVRQTRNEVQINRASVRLELQADFLAGVWAHHLQKNYGILEEGDIGEAINAANQIGDDTLQKQAGYVQPDRVKFTHGTSKQRAYWFKQGLKSGDFAACKVLFELSYDEL